MYIPASFEIKEKDVMYDIMEENSFATVISQHQGKPYATHLPLTLDRQAGRLFGHFARPNPQWQDIEKQEVLVIFQGPHCYISPSWYETDQAVPTWNYVAVHAYGEVELITDEHELHALLKSMASSYEQPDSLYQLDRVDAGYLQGLSKGIVGFSLTINKLEGKAKLSQNHPAKRQALVISQLEQIPSEDTRQIASLMRANLQDQEKG